MLAAAAAALIVLSTHVVLRVFTLLLNLGLITVQSNEQGSFPTLPAGYFLDMILEVLPFALGVFLSAWLLAPVVARISLASAILRSLIAVASGTIVMFLLALLGAVINQVSGSAGLVFGWASAFFSSMGTNAPWAGTSAIYFALSGAINLIPLTVLAGVLVWAWLREHPVQGMTPAPAADV